MTQPITDHSTVSPRATAFAIGAIALWCWSGACMAVGSRMMGAMPFLSISCVVGVITGIVAQAIQGRPVRDLFTLPPRVAIAALFGVSLMTILLILAIEIAPDGDLAQVMLINYLWPIWIVLLGIWLLDAKPHMGLVLVAAVLGFAGVAIARGIGSLTQRPESILPHALALVVSLLWAFYTVLLRRWKVPEAKGGSTLAWVACAVMAGAIAVFNGQWSAMPSVDLRAVFWILFIGIGPIGLAYHWWELGIKRGNVHLIAVLSYFIPVGSALLIGLLFREALNPALVPGALLITVGAWLGKRAARE
jgi:drug/metabolite transporter (DMT)-like permease